MFEANSTCKLTGREAHCLSNLHAVFSMACNVFENKVLPVCREILINTSYKACTHALLTLLYCACLSTPARHV